MAAYYNEIEPFAAAWLRELIARNLIAPGDVDERSIEVVSPADLGGYTQCHFFAGIGVWSYALRSAGWPDDRPVWTGSCPCQPFSGAGKGEGFADTRHLWPTWFRLIRESQPDTLFGEQVAAAAGLAWLDVVSTDLEAAGYAVGAADLCAAGVGAPHRRQRLYWLADAGYECRWAGESNTHRASPVDRQENHGAPLGRGDMGDTRSTGLEGFERPADVELRGATRSLRPARAASVPVRMGNAGSDRTREHTRELPSDESEYEVGTAGGDHTPVAPGPTGGFWRDAEWLHCTDGKARPVEPGTFPLAHGAPARVGRLRGYGNAIVAPQAQAFIEAYLDIAGQ